VRPTRRGLSVPAHLPLFCQILKAALGLKVVCVCCSYRLIFKLKTLRGELLLTSNPPKNLETALGGCCMCGCVVN
jgi:hypothetical protein